MKYDLEALSRLARLIHSSSQFLGENSHLYRYSFFIDTSSQGKQCRYAVKTAEMWDKQEKEATLKVFRALRDALNSLDLGD